ncbi:hypothetical protein N9E28_03110 [Alphaproteobacteria bacterium]|nr:hypothetical protein [Alphaproteobacteria bacterium]
MCFKKIHVGSPCRNEDALAGPSLVLDTTMTPKRQGMIGQSDKRQLLTKIGLGLTGLKLWQRLAKLALQFNAVKLALKQTGTPTKPRHYHVRNVARYHSISHHFIIWIIVHAKAYFTPPPQTKVGSAHIQTNKR